MYMADNDANPYATPASILDIERREVIRALRGPSMGLLVLSVTWGGFALFGIVVLTALTILWFVRKGEFQLFLSLDELPQLLTMLPSLFIAYGAWCMRSSRRYGVSVAAAIVACLPFLSPWIFLGIPFGIWALVLLRRQDVREAFAMQPSAKH